MSEEARKAIAKRERATRGEPEPVERKRSRTPKPKPAPELSAEYRAHIRDAARSAKSKSDKP